MQKLAWFLLFFLHSNEARKDSQFTRGTMKAVFCYTVSLPSIKHTRDKNSLQAMWTDCPNMKAFQQNSYFFLKWECEKKIMQFAPIDTTHRHHPSTPPISTPIHTTNHPHHQPSTPPTIHTTNHPHHQPSTPPTIHTTNHPHHQPSTPPTIHTTNHPHHQPSTPPTIHTTNHPHHQPSTPPTIHTTNHPHHQPSTPPTIHTTHPLETLFLYISVSRVNIAFLTFHELCRYIKVQSPLCY